MATAKKKVDLSKLSDAELVALQDDIEKETERREEGPQVGGPEFLKLKKLVDAFQKERLALFKAINDTKISFTLPVVIEINAYEDCTSIEDIAGCPENTFSFTDGKRTSSY